MGNALFHSESSAKLYGGEPEDYLPIHKFLDSSKVVSGIADWRHRAMYHHSGGVELAERLFGDFYKRPSDGKKVCTRTVAETHIMEDLGCIPAPADWLREMPLRHWMNKITTVKKKRMQTHSIEAPEQVSAPIIRTEVFWYTEAPTSDGLYLVSPVAEKEAPIAKYKNGKWSSVTGKESIVVKKWAELPPTPDAN